VHIVPVSEGEKSGAEALRSGTRVAHLVGNLGEAPSRGKHAWVGLGHLTHIVEIPADGQLRDDRPNA